jgi:hypothetical protein
VTVLEKCIPKSSVLLWVKGLNAKDIHKEMFPVYGGKSLSYRPVHSWAEKRGDRFADEEVETGVRKWLREQSKYFCAAGFSAGKAIEQVYQC